jgi:ribose 5-phosphate isomerase B
MKEVYLASDHAGIFLKETIIDHLRENGMIPHDLGYTGDGKADYPDYASKLAQNMKPVPDSYGILICGSGIGISIAANRFSWVRAALCHDVTTALDAVDAFMGTRFEAGRHSDRVEMLSQLP